MIIGVSGHIESGKDTFAEVAIPIFESFGYNFETKKFASKLKQVVALITGEPIETFETIEGKKKFLPAWNMTAREFLMKFGTDAVRDNFDYDTWVKSLFADYTYGDNWIITDVRFENEAWIIKQFGGLLVRIERESNNRELHESEIQLDNYKEFDYTINNNFSLEEYKAEVERIVKQIITKNERKF